ARTASATSAPGARPRSRRCIVTRSPAVEESGTRYRGTSRPSTRTKKPTVPDGPSSRGETHETDASPAGSVPVSDRRPPGAGGGARATAPAAPPCPRIRAQRSRPGSVKGRSGFGFQRRLEQPGGGGQETDVPSPQSARNPAPGARKRPGLAGSGKESGPFWAA